MGCPADLVRGPITDEAIRQLGCFIDEQTLLFAGTVAAGVITPIFQKGMTVGVFATGQYLVTLDEPVPPELSGVPVTVGISHNIQSAPPGSHNVTAPIAGPPVTFLVHFFNSLGVHVDPVWFSVTVHKKVV